MLAKLKMEWQELLFWRKVLIHIFFSLIAAYAYLNFFQRDWQGASVGEFVVYSMTDHNYFLVVFPLLCLVWISGKSGETCRYPLILRYRSRNEFFVTRFAARGIFLLVALLIHIGALLVVGRFLPATPQMVYVHSENLTGIVIRQFLNIYCYVCVLFLLHEILLDLVGNAILDIMLTTAVSLLNLMVVKLVLRSVVAWTPWGNIAYMLFGQERTDYRFYVFYWLFLLFLLLYLADELNGRKDYVFEESRKVD